MPYLIDGNNLLGSWGGPPDDNDGRAQVVRRVASFCRARNVKATVVFDGHPLRPEMASQNLGLVSLRVPPPGQDADTVIRELVERASFEIPEALVDRHLDARLEAAVRDLAYRGIDPRQADVNWKEVRESQRESAVKAAKAEILLDEIARRENVEALPAEVDAEVARYAERLRKPAESVRRQMEKEGALSALRARIREEKTLDLLKADARLNFD